MPEYLTLFTRELFGYIERYGAAAALTGAAAGGVYLAARKAGKVWKALIVDALLVALFCAYVVMLLAITIFSRESGSISALNLKPFDTFRYKRFTLENVMLFAPFGFFYGLAVYGKKRFYSHWYMAGAVGACASICIETAQFITARGGTEIDDVMTNTAGMLCGYVFAALVRYAWSGGD